MSNQIDELKKAEQTSWNSSDDATFDKSTEEIKSAENDTCRNPSLKGYYSMFFGIAMMFLFLNIFTGSGHMGGFWMPWVFFFFFMPMFRGGKYGCGSR